MRPGDQIITAPPKGNGASLVIEYAVAAREELDGNRVTASGVVEGLEPEAPAPEGVPVPPPTRLAPSALSAGATVVVYDYVLMGEVIGEVIEYRRGPTPMWRIRVDTDGGGTNAFFVDTRGTSHLGRWHVVRLADHPVDRFFKLAGQIGPYPTGTQSVPARIVGTAFFPGGSGLWRESAAKPLPSLPVGGIMVIGQDFHSRSKYLESAERGHENLGDPTWRELRQLLKTGGVLESECYFTNAYVGLRTDGTVTGEYPGARDEEFVLQCSSLLAEQIAAQRPRAILTLGLPAARMLASLAPNSLAGWLHAQNFVDIDSAGGAILSIRFPDIPDVQSNVVALVHPSMRNSNVSRRSYRDASGTLHEKSAAERAMLAEVLQAVGRA
jgi:uracil-DNA glycosylase